LKAPDAAKSGSLRTPDGTVVGVEDEVDEVDVEDVELVVVLVVEVVEVVEVEDEDVVGGAEIAVALVSAT
jgi:hypothetical protein